MRFRTVLIPAALLVAISVSATGHQVGYYVTERGRTYHKFDCKTIRGKTVHAVTYEEARKYKYKACKTCKPL